MLTAPYYTKQLTRLNSVPLIQNYPLEEECRIEIQMGRYHHAWIASICLIAIVWWRNGCLRMGTLDVWIIEISMLVMNRSFTMFSFSSLNLQYDDPNSLKRLKNVSSDLYDCFLVLNNWESSYKKFLFLVNVNFDSWTSSFVVHLLFLCVWFCLMKYFVASVLKEKLTKFFTSTFASSLGNLSIIGPFLSIAKHSFFYSTFLFFSFVCSPFLHHSSVSTSNGSLYVGRVG